MGSPAFFMLGQKSEAFLTQEESMPRRWTAAIFLLSIPAWASEQAPTPKDNVDISGLLSEKKPCDEDKKKAEAAAAEAKKNEAALQGLLGAEKKPEPTQKSLGAVPAMGNCK